MVFPGGSTAQPARRERVEYVCFEDALAALGMGPQELRGLIVEGKLRGFRDEHTLKFLRTEIDALRAQREARA